MHSPSSKLEGFTSSENCHLPSLFLSCELPHIQCGLNAVESQYGLREKDSSRLINPEFFALSYTAVGLSITKSAVLMGL